MDRSVEMAMFLDPRPRGDGSRRVFVEEFDLDVLTPRADGRDYDEESEDAEDPTTGSDDSSDDQDSCTEDDVSLEDSYDDGDVFIYDVDEADGYDDEDADGSQTDFINHREDAEDVMRHYMNSPPPVRDSVKQYMWPWLD